MRDTEGQLNPVDASLLFRLVFFSVCYSVCLGFFSSMSACLSFCQFSNIKVDIEREKIDFVYMKSIYELFINY